MRSEDLETYLQSKHLATYLHHESPDADGELLDDFGSIYFQIHRKAKLRVLYHQTLTPLHDELQVGVQGCKARKRDALRLKRPFSRRQRGLQVNRRGPRATAINLRFLEQNELLQIFDHWLAIWRRFVVRKRQDTLRSEEKTAGCLFSKETNSGFIESEPNREDRDGWRDRNQKRLRMVWHTIRARWFLACSPSTLVHRDNSELRNIAYLRVRRSSTLVLES